MNEERKWKLLDGSVLIVLVTVGTLLLLVLGVVVWHTIFISRLRETVKFEYLKFARKNQPTEPALDLPSILLASGYVPITIVLVTGWKFLLSETFIYGMVVYIALLIALLLIHHDTILRSFAARSNLFAVAKTIHGWDNLQIFKMFAKPIVPEADFLDRIKKSSIEYAEKNEALTKELNDFWAKPKFYTTLLQKYLHSMREAMLIVTDQPWKEATWEEPREIPAGIRKVKIPVGTLNLDFTNASETMSSEEHKKYLKVDKVEIPVFTALTTNLSSAAHRAIAAAALNDKQASDERVRREMAEARANKLQKQNDTLMKQKQIFKRMDENKELEEGGMPGPKAERIFTKTNITLMVVIGVLLILLAVFAIPWGGG